MVAQETDLELVERKPLVEHTLKAAMGTMVLTVDLVLVVRQTLGLTFSRLEQVAQVGMGVAEVLHIGSNRHSPILKRVAEVLLTRIQPYVQMLYILKVQIMK